VQCLIEANRRDGGTGDRGQQHATKRVTDGMTEAWLKRSDRETLTVTVLFADCFDTGALDDEHLSLPFVEGLYLRSIN
jgi:hypothetical protein